MGSRDTSCGDLQGPGAQLPPKRGNRLSIIRQQHLLNETPTWHRANIAHKECESKDGDRGGLAELERTHGKKKAKVSLDINRPSRGRSQVGGCRVTRLIDVDGHALSDLKGQAAAATYFNRRARMRNKAAPRTAAPGIVRTQAQKMLRVTPQRTAVKRRDAPTPTMAPVMVWVVLTGMPKCAVPSSVSAPAVSAANPPKGVSLVMRWPIVLMIRQPPAIVPPPIARWQQMITQYGTW